MRTLAAAMGLALDEGQAETLLSNMGPFADGYRYLEQLDDNLPALRYPARSYRFPTREENPLGAWYVKTALKGNEQGPLAGRTVAIKDNVFVAQVPMMNGASIMEGFIPEFDATVVTRLLDAGAALSGKAVCEFLCVSGASVTASTGVVGNPHNPDYSAGGSSSGSAALVASGAADVALGCDQAGSVRIPASFCGVYGMKASFGLLPYTGILGMEAMLDHVGPMTANVGDNALMLEILAGYDGMDSRQRQLRVHNYTEALGEDLKGMKIAVVKEGFDHPLSEPEVDRCVLAAAERFAALGAEVSEVSIPMHRDGVSLWGAIISAGLWETLRHNGLAVNTNGFNSPTLEKYLSGWQHRLAQFPVNLHVVVLLGKYLERYAGRYYAQAKNHLPRLVKAYDDPLQRHDLLLLPTTLMQARRNPVAGAEGAADEIIYVALNTVLNTCQFDVTGHPAMSVPCGRRNGLPVGMMLVAKHFDEPAIYRAAYGFEQSCDWREV